jgi:adenylate cyclase
MTKRARTLVIALVLAALASAASLALYFAPENTLPVANRIGDYIVHQNLLASSGALGLRDAESYQQPNPNLALIEIDEQSTKGVPAAGLPPFPYPRGLYKRLLDRLAQAGARVVAFDVEFLGPSADPRQDATFAQGLRREPTVLAYSINTTTSGQIGVELPPSILTSSAAALGFAALDTPGGYVVGQPSVIRTGTTGTNANQRLASLATAAVERFTGKALSEVPRDHGRMVLLPLYLGSVQQNGVQEWHPGIAQSVPFSTALTEPVADLRALVNGKLVVIGSTAEALGDFSVTAAGRQPGVFMNLRLMDQLLTGTYVRPVPVWLDVGLIVILPLLIGLALAELRPALGIAVSLLAVAAYSAFAVGIYANRLTWLDLVHVAGAMLLATLFAGLFRVVTEGAKRRVVTEMFGMHVSPAVVQEILKTDDPRAALNLKGTRVTATIFYSDIRGFTAMSETMTPEEIYSQLNQYFDAMCKIIFKYGGYVDKFIGDCIMAVFSAPFQTPDDAAKAVRAAVEQQSLIKHLSDGWQMEGKKSFTVGMGINTGDVVMGNLGATSRMNYTVIGDDVNVASRLYNVAKGGEIIISETTYELVRDIVEVDEREPVMVKGKSAPIRIYNVTGIKADGISKS